MAEAVARHHGLEADSAGTKPASSVSRNAVAVMKEAGIDTSGMSPKMLDFNRLEEYARTITMGCGVAESCPSLHTDEDWGLDDPVGQSLDVFRETLADVERRVLRLRDKLNGQGI